MRIAALGAGRMGLAHIRTLAALGTLDELIVADLDPVRAGSTAAEVGATAASIDEAFAAAPDGIVIVAPTSEHEQLILRGVDAGIAVFCEKPVAESLGSTRRVVEAVEASSVPVQIGFQRRFDPGYLAAKAALVSGELGELRRVHMLTCDPVPPPAAYIPTSGGIFRDCSIHDFDILRWMTGQEAELVFATGANRGAPFFGEAGDVDECAAIVMLEDGTAATAQSSRYNGAGYDVRMELAGTLGQRTVGLDARAPLVSAEAGIDFPAGDPWPDFQTRFATAYAEELRAFVEVAAGAAPSPCTPRDALQALYIAEAADRSRRTGRPVHLAEVAASS